MVLKRLELNVTRNFITNCYIVMDEESKEIMIIDPAAEALKIIDMVNILEGKVKYIILTHCHADHIGAVNDVKEKLGGKILAHRLESLSIQNPNVTLFMNLGLKEIEINVDSRLDDEDILHLGKLQFKIIHTPGHTSGCICIYNDKEKLLFSGDTLFSGSCGRTDLPTSSRDDIITSISNKLMILPEETIVYPGHGKSTRIKDEAKIYYMLKPKKN